MIDTGLALTGVGITAELTGFDHRPLITPGRFHRRAGHRAVALTLFIIHLALEDGAAVPGRVIAELRLTAQPAVAATAVGAAHLAFTLRCTPLALSAGGITAELTCGHIAPGVTPGIRIEHAGLGDVTVTHLVIELTLITGAALPEIIAELGVTAEPTLTTAAVGSAALAFTFR